MVAANSNTPSDFIRSTIADDLETGKFEGRVITRFPPEPNGYLHIGHAKSICLNFGIARDYPGGKCNLRFDDTNPNVVDDAFYTIIEDNLAWMGFKFDKISYSSDYLPQIYEITKKMIIDNYFYINIRIWSFLPLCDTSK